MSSVDSNATTRPSPLIVGLRLRAASEELVMRRKLLDCIKAGRGKVVQRITAPQTRSKTVITRCIRIPLHGRPARDHAQDARATSATTWARDSTEILNNYNVTKFASSEVSEARL